METTQPGQAEPEQTNPIVRAVTTVVRQTQRSVSPWVQRWLSQPGRTRQMSRLEQRPMAFTPPQAHAVVNRVQRVADNTRIWHPNVGSLEPALPDRFSQAIVDRFQSWGDKYQPQPASLGGGDETELVFTGPAATGGFRAEEPTFEPEASAEPAPPSRPAPPPLPRSLPSDVKRVMSPTPPAKPAQRQATPPAKTLSPRTRRFSRIEELAPGKSGTTSFEPAVVSPAPPEPTSIQPGPSRAESEVPTPAPALPAVESSPDPAPSQPAAPPASAEPSSPPESHATPPVVPQAASARPAVQRQADVMPPAETASSPAPKATLLPSQDQTVAGEKETISQAPPLPAVPLTSPAPAPLSEQTSPAPETPAEPGQVIEPQPKPEPPPAARPIQPAPPRPTIQRREETARPAEPASPVASPVEEKPVSLPQPEPVNLPRSLELPEPVSEPPLGSPTPPEQPSPAPDMLDLPLPPARQTDTPVTPPPAPAATALPDQQPASPPPPTKPELPPLQQQPETAAPPLAGSSRPVEPALPETPEPMLNREVVDRGETPPLAPPAELAAPAQTAAGEIQPSEMAKPAPALETVLQQRAQAKANLPLTTPGLNPGPLKAGSSPAATPLTTRPSLSAGPGGPVAQRQSERRAEPSLPSQVEPVTPRLSPTAPPVLTSQVRRPAMPFLQRTQVRQPTVVSTGSSVGLSGMRPAMTESPVAPLPLAPVQRQATAARGVVQRQETAPDSAGAATDASTETASPAAAPSTQGQSGDQKPDLDRLARQILPQIKRLLAIEQERQARNY
ncbi:MAG: hypothetical protein HS126_31675 [Anaerolineales bacterium]|nr:hypothetical protein [Anaerolineales bacterium]